MITDSLAPALSRDQLAETVAAAWQAATADLAYIPYPIDEVEERFKQLSADALAALMADGPLEATVQQGRVIGVKLVDLNLLKSEALERTLVCLSGEFAGAVGPGRLESLLAGIAGGFATAAQAALLTQQEEIGRAATLSLRRAQGELLASRDKLAAANGELSTQIAERIHAEAVQHDYAERLKYLHEIDLAILSAESLTAIVDISVDYIQRQIPALSVGIVLFDLANMRSTVISNTNPAYPAGRIMSITMNETIDLMKEGRVIYLSDLKEIRDRSQEVAKIVDMGGRSVLSVPLLYGEELIGSVTIVTNEVREFSEADISVTREIADSVAVAIQNRRLLEAEQAARERESTLREVAANLTLGLGLDEVLPRILDHLDRVIASESSAIMLVKGDSLEVICQRGIRNSPEQLQSLIAARPGSIWSILETKQPRIINNTARSPDWFLMAGGENTRSWLGVPLLDKGSCIGIMTLDRHQIDSFTPQDLELAAAFANQAAVAIKSVRLFTQLEERVRERTRELEVLYGITATAVGKPDLESLLQRSLELSIEAFGCPAGAIHLIDGEESGLQLACLLERRRPELAELLRGLDANAPILIRALRQNSPLILTGAELPAEWTGDRTLFYAVAPLLSRGRSLGVISLLSDSSGEISSLGLTLFATIADQLGVAVENIKLRQIIRQAAIIEERERLAREIHDAVTQTIFSVGLFAEAARSSAESGDLTKVQKHTRTILLRTNQAMRELRLLLFELRTEELARMGLVDALRERLRTVEHRAEVQGEVSAAGVENLPVAVEETFYRIALEALNNALRYSQAERVDISLSMDEGELVMVIADNGIGFKWEAAIAKGGMGLKSMQKRIGKVGGSLVFVSGRGGTRITARAPLERQAAVDSTGHG